MKTLLIVDLQNDFLPGGALAVPEGDTIVPVINELMPEYDLVVATQDWHPENHGSFAATHPEHEIGDTIDLAGLKQVLWPVHCIEDSLGAGFAPGLHSHRIDHVIRKGGNPGVDSYSGFHDNGRRHHTGLDEYLRDREVNEVHVVGLATEYCVKFTALDAREAGFVTVLIEDACRGADLAAGDVDRAIATMAEAGITITRSDELLEDSLVLYRPVGPDEYALIKANGFKAWPPRLPGQPIFYPVTNQAYAEQIARDWNLPESDCAYVTRFRVRREFLRNYPRKVVGGRRHEELWIPAEDLDALKDHLDGPIEITTKLEPTEA